MADAAALTKQLEALRTAYASGAQSVSYDGKTTTFRSGDEMRAAISSLQAQLGIGGGARLIVVRSDKGW